MTPNQKLALLWQGLWLVISAGIVFWITLVVSLVVSVSPLRNERSGKITRAVSLIVGVVASGILLILAWHLAQVAK